MSFGDLLALLSGVNTRASHPGDSPVDQAGTTPPSPGLGAVRRTQAGKTIPALERRGIG
jgi:hypothetical protein